MNSYDYKHINNVLGSIRPSVIHANNTEMRAFYTKYLLQRILSVFKFEGLPDTWAENYFKYTLFTKGYLCIFDAADYGVIPQDCSLTGRNVFYQPKEALINNQAISPTTITKTIGIDCELLRLQPDYGDVNDIIEMYSDLLSISLDNVALNMLNTKTAKIFQAKHKGAAEAVKKVVDKIQSGELMAVLDAECFDDSGKPLWLDYDTGSNNYNAGSRLDDYQTILNQFDSIIGIIPPSDKKERMNVSEVHSSSIASQPLSDLWLDTMQKDIKKINAMFNLNISVSKNYDLKEEEPDNDINN